MRLNCHYPETFGKNDMGYNSGIVFTNDFGQPIINFWRWVCINGKMIVCDRPKLSKVNF
ncbi:MAG: hypothetical protein V7L31_12080 [Nostoc sp.]